MQPSQAAINLVKVSEGLRLDAYPDPGTGAEPWTIGWGHTGGVHQGMSITEQQADEFLAADLAVAAAVVSQAVKVPLTQFQLDALADFVFNVGPGKKGIKDGFVELKSGEPSTLLRLLNGGQLQAAAAQFKYWVMAGGKPAPGLVKRRAAEAALFLSKPFADVTGGVA